MRREEEKRKEERYRGRNRVESYNRGADNRRPARRSRENGERKRKKVIVIY